MTNFRKFVKSFLDMLRKSEAKAAVAHRSAPQRHRRTPSVLTKRAPAPSPDAVGGRIALSRTFVAPAFKADKNSRCDIKFVKWLVRKNRALSMSKKDDELNDFVDEVTDADDQRA